MIHYFFYEKSFDKFFDSHKDIYEVRYSEEVEGNKYHYAICAPGFGPALKKEFPEVKNYTRLCGDDLVTIFHDDAYHQNDIVRHVDSTFFEIFSYKFLNGSKENVLKEANSVVLTESSAKKYFGQKNPIGESLIYRSVYGEQYNLMVKGVIEDNPVNSTIEFDLVLSNQNLFKSPVFSFIPTSLNDFFGAAILKTYIQLEESAKIEDVEKKMDSFVAKYKGQDYKDRNWEFTFTKIEDVHLNSAYADGITFKNETGNGKYIRFYLILTLIIISLIIINFSNLYVSEINERKEKTQFRNWIGEKKIYMLFQFLFENFIISIISVVVAFIALYMLRDHLNSIFEIQIFDNIISDPKILLLLFSLFVVTIVLPSILAFFAIGLKNQSNGGTRGTMAKSKVFFNVTTITQLVIAIVIIAFTLTIRMQFKYLFNKSTGIKSENTIVLNLPTLDNSYSKYNKFKLELQEENGVERVSGNRYLISDRIYNVRRVKSSLNNDNEYVLCSFNKVDLGFFETFDIPLVEGEYLKKGQPNNAIVLNETAVKRLKIEDTKSAIGSLVTRGQTFNFEKEWVVVGVVKDYHQELMNYEVSPQMFFDLNNYEQPVKFIYISLKSDGDEATLSKIRDIWSSYFPPSLFQYKYVDEVIHDKYTNERRIYILMLLFTVIFICNMCLNMFSLSSFLMNRKTKEICIRKVLGANTGQVVSNLLKDFYPLIIISILIAVPLLILLIREFLNSYPHKIPFPWQSIFVTILMILLIVGISISYFLVKIVRKNPAIVLKEE